jgi:flagellin-specific chaperone FliS
MFIASEKKRDNIAEYLLYMWQIEDMIRAYDLDLDRINAEIISKYTNLTDEQRKQLYEWYESLIDMMRREGVEKQGHLQLNKNVIIALDDLHRRLLADEKFAKYSAEFYRTLPYIVELRAKAGDQKTGEIETCLNALYGILMLRLKGKEITKETMDAIRQISSFIAMLSYYYKKDYNNELFNHED